jgi:two-component system LytT family sensor kinase
MTLFAYLPREVAMPPRLAGRRLMASALAAWRTILRRHGHVLALLLLYQFALKAMVCALNVLAMANRPAAAPVGAIALFFGNLAAPDEVITSVVEFVLCAGLYLLLDRMDRRPLVIKMIVGLGAGIGIAILHAAGCWLEIAWSHPALTQPAGIVIARNFLFSLTPIALWAVTAITLTHSRLLQERDRMLAELRIATQEAQMRALRYQLNPHFLFNSLNSLSGMVWERDWRGAETMVIAFSEFLREVLASDPHDDVPLDRELEMQRKYLEIEEARFAGRLHIDFIVEPGLDSIAVPNLILQPLVENAIKHGVAPIAAPVALTIAARRSGGRLRLTVENASVTVSPGRPGMGIGLANVRARLNGRFGNRAALIAQATRHGFIATVTLPLGPA